MEYDAVRVVEQFVMGKSGRPEDCEDALVILPDFVCVIDGATTKSDLRFAGRTPGLAAARALTTAIKRLPPDSDAPTAVAVMTSALAQLYRRHKVYDLMQREPIHRATASIGIYSRSRREVWLVGDCQCRVGDAIHRNPKAVDEIIANTRSLFLASEIVLGRSLASLMERDTGREFVLPLLERQSVFQNAGFRTPYAYSVIDGFPVNPGGIVIVDIGSYRGSIVIATDGYPVLDATLARSEEALRSLLSEDPLCFGQLRSTKGLSVGDDSFDDRAFVRIEV